MKSLLTRCPNSTIPEQLTVGSIIKGPVGVKRPCKVASLGQSHDECRMAGVKNSFTLTSLEQVQVRMGNPD
jgi:hypothetical protein